MTYGSVAARAALLANVAVAAGSSGVSTASVGLIAGAAALVGGAVVALAAKRRRGTEVPPPTQGRQNETADSAILVSECIAVADLVESRALQDRLIRGLAGVDVRPVSADGERFDPKRHTCVEITAAPEPRYHDMVASTNRPGYVQGGRILRQPQVVVYRWESNK